MRQAGLDIGEARQKTTLNHALVCWADGFHASGNEATQSRQQVDPQFNVCGASCYTTCSEETQESYGAGMGLKGAVAEIMEADSASVFKKIRAELLDEYRQDHNYPWIIGYSGGKDSTLVAHLVIEMLMGLPPSQRKRHVHIVANDTLVESPLVFQHIIDCVQEIENAANAFGLPVC